MEHSAKRPSIFWPLLLIAAGIAFLLANFGYIEADFWYTISRLWPLLFIVVSLDSLWKGEDFAGSLVMLAFGALLLSASLGYLNYGALELLIRLWPVFIIAIALNIIFGRAPIWAALIGGLFGIALIAGVFWFSNQPARPLAGASEAIVQTLDGAAAAEVVIDMGIADLEISGGLTGSNLASGELRLARGHRFESQYETSGRTGTYTLETSGEGVFWPTSGLSGRNISVLQLNSDVPLDLDSRVGVGELTVDLSALDVSAFSARIGVGTIDVTLPAEGAFAGSINGGVGSTVVRVPDGASVRIDVDRGITAMSIPPGFERQGDTILSPGTSAGAADIRLTLEQPIGELTITRR